MGLGTLRDNFKDDKEVHFLIELDFDGHKKRFTTCPGGASITNSGGDDLFFDGLISSMSDVSTTFDLSSFRYSTGSVDVDLINKDRFQDNEVRHRLDGGTGKIWAWSQSMDWAILEDYPIFSGGFIKKSHDKHIYSFSLDESIGTVYDSIPKVIINSDTWPYHKTDSDGSGSVSGKPSPIVLGDWNKGVPLLCVNSTGYQYLLTSNDVVTASSNYPEAIENVYDLSETVIASSNYTFYPGYNDSDGNLCSYFTFISSRTASEPISCSVQATKDASGEITGTAGTLIENPADIYRWLLENFITQKDSTSDYIDLTSIKTMQTVLGSLKFATIIKVVSNLGDIIDRVLYQCLCAKIQRWGKIGVVVFDLNGNNLKNQYEFDMIGKTRAIESTDKDLIANNFKLYYDHNPTTEKYESTLEYNKTTNTDCKYSALQYGERNLIEIQLNDIRDEATAKYFAKQLITLFTFRHDIVRVEVPYWEGFGRLEGDIHKLTIEEGGSYDGEGWSQEECILLDQTYGPQTIIQRWLRINTY